MISGKDEAYKVLREQFHSGGLGNYGVGSGVIVREIFSLGRTFVWESERRMGALR